MQEHRISVTRSARYYTSGDGSREVADVWFVLHGYGQLAGRLLRHFESLAGEGRLVVAPEGLSRFYVGEMSEGAAARKVGASWMTREDRLAEIADYVRYLDAVYATVLTGRERSRARVTVLGFSQGTATACRWLAQGVAHAERLILWGGEIPPDLDLVAARERLARVDLTLVAGRRDEFITPKILARERERLTTHGISFRVVQFDGGHEIDERVLRELGELRETGNEKRET